jgi:hypothetical protein
MLIKTKIDWYLKRIGKESLEDSTLIELKKIFLFIIKHFKNQEISLENLSFLTDSMVNLALGRNDLEDDFVSLIQDAADLTYFLRRIPEEDGNGERSFGIIRSIFSFYQENKNLIE